MGNIQYAILDAAIVCLASCEQNHMKFKSLHTFPKRKVISMMHRVKMYLKNNCQGCRRLTRLWNIADQINKWRESSSHAITQSTAKMQTALMHSFACIYNPQCSFQVSSSSTCITCTQGSKRKVLQFLISLDFRHKKTNYGIFVIFGAWH